MAMEPVFRKRPRGDSYARVPDVFYCVDHGSLAKGRKKTQFLA